MTEEGNSTGIEPGGTILIPTEGWTPSSGLDRGQTVGQRLREVEEMRGEQHEIDPSGLLFAQRGKEPKVLSDDEKPRYRNELSRAVLGKLEKSFEQGTTLYEMFEEIRDEKDRNPETSLFTEINTRLEMLWGEPDEFEVNDKVLSEDERGKAMKTLRDARRIITEAAKDAGIFDSLGKSFDEIDQNPDYEMGLRQLQDLKSNPQRLYNMEVLNLNRSSPDFAGVSVAYINGAIYNREYYLRVAEAGFYQSKADAAHDPNLADLYRTKSEESADWAKEFGDARYTRHWGRPRPQLTDKAMNYLIRKDRGTLYAEQQVGGPGLDGQYAHLQRVIELLEENQGLAKGTYDLELQRQKQQMELYYKGHEQFVHAVTRRTYVNPEQFDQQLPNWFEYKGDEISREEREAYQEANRFALNAVSLAYVKELSGPKTYDNWVNAQGIRFNREQYKAAWDSMPGFRQAMLTMSKDLFEDSDSDIFKEGGLVEGEQKLVLSETGYQIFANKDNLKLYKEGLVDGLVDHLKDNPDVQKWARDHVYISSTDTPEEEQKKIDEGVRNVIQSSVYTADNFYFASGSYDSAYELRGGLVDEKERVDREGKITRKAMRKKGHPEYAGNADITVKSSIGSDGIISFMHPGRKLAERILKAPEDRGEALAVDRAERRFAGPVGNWVADNVVHNRGKFREEFLNGDRNYIPETMYFSMLEMVDITIEKGKKRNWEGRLHKGNKIYLSDLLTDGRRDTTDTDKQVLLKVGDKEKTLDIVLADVVDETNVDMEDMAPEEMWGFYMDMSTAMINLSEHLTSADPKRRANPDSFLDSYIKLKDKPRLEKVLKDPNFLKASIGLLISPEKGFKDGQTELVLDIDRITYLGAVNNILNDDRFFMSTDMPSRKELLKAYHSGDANNLLDVLFDTFTSETWIDPLDKKRRDAEKKKKKELEELEEQVALKREEKRKRLEREAEEERRRTTVT